MDDLFEGWRGLPALVDGRSTTSSRRWRAGAPARYRRYDWVADEFAEEHVVEPVDLLVLEGVGTGHPCLRRTVADAGLGRAPTTTCGWRAGWSATARPCAPHWEQLAWSTRRRTSPSTPPRARGPDDSTRSGGCVPRVAAHASSHRRAVRDRGGGYRAVVTECGAALRLLEHAGRPLLDGFDEDEMPSGGRGQLLMPWPNRIRDGALHLRRAATSSSALTEPGRGNASHGLVRWAAWTLEEHTAELGVAGLPADGADRLPVDARPARALRPVRRRADRHPDRHQPVGAGRRRTRAGRIPYLQRRRRPGRPLGADAARRDPAARRRPAAPGRATSRSRARRTTSGWRGRARPPCSTTRSATSTATTTGVATVVLRDPATGRGVALWVDEQHRWLMVFSADDGLGTRRDGRWPSSR